MPNQESDKEIKKEIKRNEPKDQVESARILMNEGLLEEARKTLFRVLAQKPDYSSAKALLKQIEELELKEIFRDNRKSKIAPPSEDADQVIEALERDLGIKINSSAETAMKTDAQDPRQLLDLGIAFFEMDRFEEALRELTKAEKKIRIEETFLGELGLSIVALIAQCLLKLNRAYDAKIFLEPVLSEPDLKHEDKLSLYYIMGLIEQALGQKSNALGWFERVAQSDGDFKDVQACIQQLRNQIKATPGQR